MSIQNEPSGNAEPRSVLLPEHLPSPTAWPAALALAVTLVFFGVVTSWIVSAVGLAVFLVAATGWFKELRNDQLQ